MRMNWITLVLALAAGGCATAGGEQHPASHGAAAQGEKKPMACGMHAARAGAAASAAAPAGGHDLMKHHCAHMQTDRGPAKE